MQAGAGPDPETISGLLARRAARGPEVHALFAPGRQPLSYDALHSLVESTRARLRALGVARQDRVAIVLANGPEMASSFLAVAGAAVCAPLNPNYVASEFEFYLQDLAPKLVLVREGAESPVRAVAQALGMRVAELRVAAECAAGEFTLEAPHLDAVEDDARPDDVALILHTSGTTSRPKMVPLSQRNLCVSAHSIARSFALTPQDLCLNVMPLFHIHGLVGAVLSSLAAGAGVVSTPGFSSARFFGWLDEFAPTWYTAVPTMHQEILARAEANREIVERRRLRFVRSCSASLAPSLLSTLEQALQAPVLESYGMTEAAHQMASNPLPPRAHKPGSVGVASGPEVAIMDGEGALLGAGATGEIVIRGANVTSGYLGVPEANRKAFTNGWFRTGDQGYLDSDGYLFLTGRLKEIINRGGETISPREIDEVMLEHPGVAQAVAFAVPHWRLGEEVGAAVVRKPGANLDERQLREFVAARLSTAKVPRVVRFLDAIPKGPTGKLQRIGLAARLGIEPIGEPQRQAEAEYIAPGTPIELRLAAIWREMLGLERIGVNAHFFTIGGDSLAAAQLVSRVSKEFAVELAFVRFLETPTIATMAGEIEAAAPSAPRHPHLVSIRPQGTHPPLFCAAGHDEILVGFGTLARYLPPDLPVLAFAPLKPEEAAAARTIQAQAARNLAAMRSAQPSGPYFLLGLCHGGLVTYEMARQLERSGERVALLALVDAYPSGWKSSLTTSTRVIECLRHGARRTRMNLGAVFGRGGWKHLRNRLSLFRAAWAEKATGAALRTGVKRDRGEMRWANREAQRNYRAEPYGGSVSLFRSTTPRAGVYPIAADAWRRLVRGEFEIVDVDTGFESTLADPGAQSLAAELTNRLQIPASITQA
jgi:acyl-CoA synthetase (AMP-forming)/AMP-acid ligase II/thioesterase domain-containing protein/acyl carrier protein